MRLIIVAIAGVLSLPSPSLSAVLKSDAQVRQTLAGNTVSGDDEGKPYAEYFSPDGFIRGQDPEGPYTGEWRISGAQVCMRYFEPEDDTGTTSASKSMSAWECMRVELNGARFAWVDDDGERYEAQLAAGNPKYL